MSEDQPDPYKLDHAPGVPAQLAALKNYCKQINRFEQLIGILGEAVVRLRANPEAWGDPEYRSKQVDAVIYHALIRPVVFRFVIYEQVRGVVLLSVKLYASFD